MKQHHPSTATRGAFTLLEMTVVIMVLLTLAGIGSFSATKIAEWKLGRAAGETLRSVYSAQRMYLADRPTTLVSNITAADLLPYIPGKPSTMPTVESLDGSQLSINFKTSPPVVDAGGGAPYDPSGSTTDSLWDVGE